jgi:hypothetical protein
MTDADSSERRSKSERVREEAMMRDREREIRPREEMGSDSEGHREVEAGPDEESLLCGVQENAADPNNHLFEIQLYEQY